MRRKKTKGKQVVRSKKTTIDGIEFASTLESVMYKMLKQNNIKFTYEGKTYTTFNPFKLKNPCYERVQKRSESMVDRRLVSKVSYTPDFIGDNEAWFIETKGRANESFSIRWKLFKEMLHKEGKNPLIFKPTNTTDCLQVIDILKKNGY